MLFQPRQLSHFSAFERHVELAASELYRVHWNSPDLNPLDYHVWTVMSEVPCWKSTINTNWSLRRLMSWKLPCIPSGKSCYKNTSTRPWRTSPSAWLPTWLPMVVTSNIWIFFKSVSSFHHQQTGLFQSNQKTTLGTLRNGAVLVRTV